MYSFVIALTTVFRFICESRDTILIHGSIITLPRETLAGVIGQGEGPLRVVTTDLRLSGDSGDTIDPIQASGSAERRRNNVVFSVARQRVFGVLYQSSTHFGECISSIRGGGIVVCAEATKW
jgi:hypothetical protein